MGLSFAAIFVDLASAFASIIRRLGVGVDVTDIELVKRLKYAGFDTNQCVDIVGQLRRLRLWERAGTPENVCQILREILGNTFFTMEHLSGTVPYVAGTTAGTSMADIIFAVSFSVVLKQIRTQIEAEGLGYSTQTNMKIWNGSEDMMDVQFHEVSYSDDVAYPVIALESKDLQGRVTRTMQVIFDNFTKMGLTINFGVGKSEAVFSLRGPNKIKARIKLEKSEYIPIKARNGTTLQLAFNKEHRHVGSKFVTGNILKPEVRTKMAKINIQEAQFVLRNLRHENCPPELKYNMARAFVLSKGLFGSGVWPALKETEYRLVHCKIMKVFRSFTRDWTKDTGHDDETVLALYGLPSPAQLVSTERLTLLCRVIANGTVQLRLALSAAFTRKTTSGNSCRSWLFAALDELSCLANRHTALHQFRNISFPQICQIIEKNPKAASRLIRKTLLFDGGDPYFALDGGGRTQRKDVGPLRDPFVIHTEGFVCADCNMGFVSEQSLAAHAHKKHGTRSEIDSFIHGTTCWACCTQFWTMSRIKQHLSKRAKGNRCIRALRTHGLTVEVSKSQVLRDRDSKLQHELLREGRRAHYAEKSVFRIIGPGLN
jgi:hypothetical protein